MKLNWTHLFCLIIGAGLVFLIQRGCDGRALNQLSKELDEAQKQIAQSQTQVKHLTADKDSLDHEVYRRDSIYLPEIDSLTKVINKSKKDYNFQKQRIKSLVETLISSQHKGDTSGLSYKLDSLKIDLVSADWTIGNLQSDYEQRDSICISQNQFLKSSYDSLSRNYDSLKTQYWNTQNLIQKMEKSLDDCMTKLGNRNKQLLWRTLGEAILVGLLILKK